MLYKCKFFLIYKLQDEYIYKALKKTGLLATPTN